MSTQTTGHFGNTTPFETLQPKGSVGRVSTTVVNQSTGDAVLGNPAVVFAHQKGVSYALADAAIVVLAARAITDDVLIDVDGESAITVTLPALASVQALAPDLKFGDKFSFEIFAISDGQASTITLAAGAGNVISAGAPLEVKADESHVCMVTGKYYDNAGTPTIRYGCVWSNQAIYTP
jgi:hypothetical protein